MKIQCSSILIFRIGYSIAERLAQEGSKVVISSRKQKNVDQALGKLKAQNLNVYGIVCNVSNQEHRMKLYNEVPSKYYKKGNKKSRFHLQTVKQFGGINILVSNAGINPMLGGVLEVNLIFLLKY